VLTPHSAFDDKDGDYLEELRLKRRRLENQTLREEQRDVEEFKLAAMRAAQSQQQQQPSPSALNAAIDKKLSPKSKSTLALKNRLKVVQVKKKGEGEEKREKSAKDEQKVEASTPASSDVGEDKEEKKSDENENTNSLAGLADYGSSSESEEE